MNRVVNTAVYLKPQLVLDIDDAPVTTKVNGDWTKTARLLGASTTAVPTITHHANGYYDIAVTFPAVGNWSVEYSVVVDGVTVTFDPQLVEVLTAPQFDPVAYLAGASVTLVSPLSADGGTLTIYQGDSYAAAQTRQISWNLTGQPDLTTATVTLKIVSGCHPDQNGNLDHESGDREPDGGVRAHRGRNGGIHPGAGR
jgi:hypothetical protein